MNLLKTVEPSFGPFFAAGFFASGLDALASAKEFRSKKDVHLEEIRKLLLQERFFVEIASTNWHLDDGC